MTDKDILANAPDDPIAATHIDKEDWYWSFNGHECYVYNKIKSGWYAPTWDIRLEEFRSLADIRALVEKDDRIKELEKERDALTLECTMLEAEFESALDLTDSICSMNTKKERLATYQQYLTTTTFETTLAKRDLEQQAKGVEDFFGLTEPYLSMGKNKMWRIDDVIVDEYVKQLREVVQP